MIESDVQVVYKLRDVLETIYEDNKNKKWRRKELYEHKGLSSKKQIDRALDILMHKNIVSYVVGKFIYNPPRGE